MLVLEESFECFLYSIDVAAFLTTGHIGTNLITVHRKRKIIKKILFHLLNQMGQKPDPAQETISGR
jgi:hypothetical protein